MPKQPTKFVTLFRRRGSPFVWLRFVLPPNARRSLDESQLPFPATIHPDHRDRVNLSLKTANRRVAEAVAAKVEMLIRKAWEDALTRDVFNAITKGSAGRIVTLAEFFEEVRQAELARVQIAATAGNPLDSRKRSGLQPETAQRWQLHRTNFRRWLQEDFPGRQFHVNDVDGRLLLRFKDWMLRNFSVGSYDHAKGYLSGAWQLAVSKDYCDRNPWTTKELRAPRDPKRDWPVLTQDDRAAVLAAPRTWAVNGLQVMLFTGARPSDLVWLQRTHVNFRTGTLTLFQSKTGKTLDLPILGLMPELAAALRAQLAAHNHLFVFPNSQGQRNQRQYLDKQFNTALHRIVGRHVSAYTFRRSAATELDRAGVDRRAISEWLGHATVEQTLVYIQRRQEAFTKAAEKVGTRLGGERQRNLGL